MDAAMPYERPLTAMEEEAELDLFLLNTMEGEADLVPPPPDLTSAPPAPPHIPPRSTPTPSNASSTDRPTSPSSGSSVMSSVAEGAHSSWSSRFPPRPSTVVTINTKQKASNDNSNRSSSFMAEVAAAGAADGPPPPYSVVAPDRSKVRYQFKMSRLPYRQPSEH